MSEKFDSPFDKESHALFHRILTISSHTKIGWEELSTQVPTLPRAWFELARLCPADRIEFTRAFWLSQLPFVSSHCTEGLEAFFDELETIEIYATQLNQNQPFEVHMIYVLEHDGGFFQGGPGAREVEIQKLQTQFSHLSLPPDYLAFLRIHNGFSKYTDTGLIKLKNMSRIYQTFQEMLAGEELIRPDGKIIDPRHLIPFYESFGLHCYQCYYTEWYIDGHMGNLFFSAQDRTLSNFLDETRLEENLAFPAFLNWLVFYLEDVWQTW